MLSMRCLLAAPSRALTLGLLSIALIVPGPAMADNAFDRDILDDAEVDLPTLDFETEGEEAPYLLYGYQGSKLFFGTRDGKFSFIPTFNLQNRHELSFDANGISTNSFSMRRARAQFNGHFMDRNLKYEIDMEMRTPNNTDNIAFRLQDFFLEYRFTNWLRVVAGQYKIPYSYQFIVSGARLQFNERSIADRVFSPGRDVGVMAFGRTDAQDIHYSLGVFNGGGQNSFNDNQHLASLAHIRWTPLGRYPTEEPDLEGVETPRVLFTAQSYLDQDPSGQDTLLNLSAYGGFKWQGLAVHGQYFQRFNVEDRVQDNPLAVDASGYYLQGGYFILPKKLEFAVRNAQVFRTGLNLQEYNAALNYYVWGDNLKFQLDYSLLYNQAAADDARWTHRVLSQVQMMF
ncbi:MAG: hypothetical protein IGS03_00185 [Candidatus Sericytochromatia bacterium]|nr:hypothetical protein [Candidatus Sericytochromatia bacterium]